MLKFFPFEITYRKKLKNKFNDYSNEKIIEFFIQDFEKSGVRNIRRENINKVIADIMFFAIRPGWNWNRWVGISYGTIEIVGDFEKENRVVVYKFNQSRLLIMGFIASIFVGITSQMILFGLGAFGFMCVLTWGIKLLQHYITFYETFDEMIFERKRKEKEIAVKN
jgi:hypothetical protein